MAGLQDRKGNMGKLVLVRHGQSVYNLENRFTGWKDVGLTEKGIKEAKEASKILSGFKFDLAFTSKLKRAQITLDLILGGMNHNKIDTIYSQALNERDYGELVGQNKAEAAQKFGDKQVQVWRRSFDTPPPGGESLKMTSERAIPYFKKNILSKVTNEGMNIIVSAHGNSIRSIVMEILNLEPKEILMIEMKHTIDFIISLEVVIITDYDPCSESINQP